MKKNNEKLSIRYTVQIMPSPCVFRVECLLMQFSPSNIFSRY